MVIKTFRTIRVTLVTALLLTLSLALSLAPINIGAAFGQAGSNDLVASEEAQVVENESDETIQSNGEPSTEPSTEPTPEQLQANALLIEQTSITMPSIQAYARVDNGAGFEAGNIIASLDSTPLQVRSILPNAADEKGVLYFFLVDVSTSIRHNQIAATKQALKDFRYSLRENDRMVLISFGQDIDIMLNGTEDVPTAEATIDQLVANENATLLYDAINTAIEMSASRDGEYPTRKVAFVISDGVDYNEGGHTRDELLASLHRGSLPLYALGFDTGEKVYLDSFGELARESNGQIAVVSSGDLASKLFEFNDYLRAYSLVSLEGPDNIVSNQTQALSIKMVFGSKTIEKSMAVEVREWIPDEIAPTVTSIEQLDDRSIRVDFNEPLLGADDPAHYVVKDSRGASLVLQSVKYREQMQTASVEISFEEKPFTGSYSIEFINISDKSMEHNALTEPGSFEFTGQPIALYYLGIVLHDYWWVIALVVLIAVVLVVYGIIRRRKGLVKVEGSIGFGDSVEFQHHFETPNSKPICLIVTDMKGNANKVELDVSSSIFIGRSRSNNLSFDDTKMSRQHFTIENTGDAFYITDLETTNGTYLNGTLIKGRHHLNDGDVITAGHEKFVFKSRGAGDSL
jgi:Mg-chelatase subunit ChlD